ncbi:MarR family winged helix-turn-helix transcriptional regulator [Arthrobacter rhombi]|uniref:Transcriptional regulator, MarR family n=1 Tax=Arthrobacter rhombi TaxID=71253 RepID=A0A1R4G044_9MICC|nr:MULTISPECIES: helix-turn-helix domain-containing protein [Micrococcaceae]PCC26839.1 MarR family transcriptional regulator [Glutamicibacter sp. BW78]SJM61518.1 transcriptional regulator, MarR family [Arthrobacter rhombi]
MNEPDPVDDAVAQRTRAIHDMEEQLSFLWRRARSNGNKVAKQVHPDMEPGAYGLLAALQRRGTLRLTELAAEIGVGKPSVSRQVKMLEELGVLAKVADPADGRAQSITLTRAGAQQLAAAQTSRQHIFRDLLADWPDEELLSLAALLTKLNGSYLNDRG